MSLRLSKNQLYECNISTTPTGLLIQPTAKTTVTLVDKGGGEWLYSEWGADIRDIFDSQPDGPEPVAAQKYVLSARERQQASRIQWLLAALAPQLNIYFSAKTT